MDITTLLSILDKYGWGGIGCIFALLIVYYIVKWQTNKMTNNVNKGLENIANKITDNINNVNTELVRSVTDTQSQLLDYLRNGQREEHLEHIDQRFDIAEILQTKVRDINNTYHCTRTCILELHNSKENFSGLPFAWYDVQYEHMKKGVKSISNKCRNMQAANLLPVIQDLQHNDYVFWNATALEELFDRSPVLYSQIVEELHARGMIYLGLYSKENRILGFLSLEFRDDIPIDIIDFTELINEAGNISTLLQLNRAK